MNFIMDKSRVVGLTDIPQDARPRTPTSILEKTDALLTQACKRLLDGGERKGLRRHIVSG